VRGGTRGLYYILIRGVGKERLKSGFSETHVIPR
jgi:hypothetical protein